MLLITYKIAHIRLMIFKSVMCILFILYFGLDAGLEPGHFAEQPFRAPLPVEDSYI